MAYWVWVWSILTFLAVSSIIAIPNEGRAAEFTVYSVYKQLDMGNPGEQPLKDYFVNIGSAQGVRSGTILTVMKRSATYDLLSEKLFKDVIFPIARLKVIHVENNAAVARLEKMLPTDKTPAVTPHAIMIGDIVRIAE